jgi:ABC-type multidrug transport system ATPase subunit
LELSLTNIGKRYNREWIFRGINATYRVGDSVAILGANGSGKSTLLQVFSGYLTPSEGSIQWHNDGKRVGVENIFRDVALATPYMTNYDEFTLQENIDFFLSFKKFRNNISVREAAELMGLSKQLNKQLKHYSSGMKQRVKLGLAILSDTKILLLDEPSSHLDINAISWYQDLLKKNSSDRVVFVASNKEEAETIGWSLKINIEDFKLLDAQV